MGESLAPNIRSDFIRSTGWTLLAQLLVNAHGIVFIPLVVKTAGVDTYGGYVLVIISLGFLFGVSSIGIGYNFKRYLASAAGSRARNELFYPQFFARAVVTLLLSCLLAFSPALSAQGWLRSQHVLLSTWLIPIYFVGMLVYTEFSDYFRFTRQMVLFNISIVAAPYLNIGQLAIGSSLGLFDLNVNMLVISQSLALWMVGLVLLAFALRDMGLPRIFMDIHQSWEDIRIAFPLTLELVVNTILNIGDRFLIAYFLTVTEVGYYSPAYAIGALIIFIPNVSWLVMPPLLSIAVDNRSDAEARRLIGYTVRGFLLIAVPFVVGVSILSKPILRLLANDAVADNAYLVVPFVAMGTVFYGLYVVFSNMLFVRKQTKLAFQISLVAAVTNILLNIVFLSAFRNIVVSGIVTLLSYLIAFMILQRRIADQWRPIESLGYLARSLLASIAMATVLVGLPLALPAWKTGTSFLLAEIAVGAATYFGALLLFGGISKKDIVVLWRGFFRLAEAQMK